MSEFDIVNDCYNYLVKKEIYKTVVCEVPFLSRCIDMVLVTEDNRIVTIEFKIKNWRKAIEQAKNHKLGSDYTYICLPYKEEPSPYLLEELTKANIGLYLYCADDECKIKKYLDISNNEDKVEVFSNLLLHTVNQLESK